MNNDFNGAVLVRTPQSKADDLRRFRSIAIFLARVVLKIQAARDEAIKLSPKNCRHYLLNEFPILHGPQAESLVERVAALDEVGNSTSPCRSSYAKAGWVPVTTRYPGAQPYTWSRSVLVLLDTGGVAISNYFDRQNLKGKWLNLEEGFGIVTHWHELPERLAKGEQLASIAGAAHPKPNEPVLEKLHRTGLGESDKCVETYSSERVWI